MALLPLPAQDELQLTPDELERLTGAAQTALSERIKAFQFRDSRAKAASEIEDIKDAQKLLAHSDTQITQTVYRRVGERVKPTR